jgi:hypothetical protein
MSTDSNILSMIADIFAIPTGAYGLCIIATRADGTRRTGSLVGRKRVESGTASTKFSATTRVQLRRVPTKCAAAIGDHDVTRAAFTGIVQFEAGVICVAWEYAIRPPLILSEMSCVDLWLASTPFTRCIFIQLRLMMFS